MEIVWGHSRASWQSHYSCLVLRSTLPKCKISIPKLYIYLLFSYILNFPFKAKVSKMYSIKVQFLSIWMAISLGFAQNFEFQDGNSGK